MKKMLLFCLCVLLLCQHLMADEIKPLQLIKGQKYELRIFHTSTVGNKTVKNAEKQKKVNQDLYEFEVKEANRKKGYILEIKHCRSEKYVLKKKSGDSLWYEVNCWNSDIVAPYLTISKNQGKLDKTPFILRLALDLHVPDSLKTRKEYDPLLEKAFRMGGQAVYQLTDTILTSEKVNREKFSDEQETEIRFTLIDTQPFEVTIGEEKNQVEIWERTNTRLSGKIAHADEVQFILLDLTKGLPLYESKTCRVPVVNGKFEFRLQLEDPLEYVRVAGEQYLFLEPGDDLLMEMDSLTDRSIRFSGLGAANNQYYNREVSRWEDSLSQIRRKEWCNKEYYAGIENMAKDFNNKLDTLRPTLTPVLHNHMKNFFKYGSVYQKLMRERDSTVGPFDCIQGVELCNPLAVNVSEYLFVLRHMMLFIMPERLAMLSQGMKENRNHYDRAVTLLDGKVLNVMLVGMISEALASNFERGKMMYDRYKRDYQASPYSGGLDQVFQKQGRLAPGKPAPDFTLKDAEGHEVSLADFRGKVVYIDFWSTGCAPCMYEFKYTAPALETYFQDKEVVFLNISGDSQPATWKKTLKRYAIQGVNLLDTKDREVSALYAVQGTPHYVLIGKDGRIISRNAPRPSHKNIRELIEKALAE